MGACPAVFSGLFEMDVVVGDSCDMPFSHFPETDSLWRIACSRKVTTSSSAWSTPSGMRRPMASRSVKKTT